VIVEVAPQVSQSRKNADNLGNQCGGWTIDWQGRSGSLPSGTTILQAIRQAASEPARVTFSRDGSGAAGADVAVAVVGELPYAEMSGDRMDLSLDPEDLETIGRVARANVPVVLVLVSGRPLMITDVLPRVDAALAVWLPGTEGEGVADVLFGGYKPTGKLSMPWPRSLSPGRDVLFPAGYGLTY
jgi:beta-glucosidase